MMKKIEFELYEILVPTVSNDGKPFRTKHHRSWDEKIRRVSDGLTIMSPVKGQWKSLENELFIERMIPVRIACHGKQIEHIVKITMQHYDQLAVMIFKITNECFIFHKEQNDNSNN